MAETTEIGWVNRTLSDGRIIPGATFNIVWGCEEAGPECKNCYARTWAKRMGFDVWGPKAPRRVMSDSYWQQPLKWNRRAEKEGEVKLVFCSSMADVFEKHPTVEAQRPRLWELIQATPWLTWLLLTKRPQNIKAMYPPEWLQKPPHNVWLGASAGNQKWAERRVPALLEAPAVLRFLSCEPLIGPLDLRDWLLHEWSEDHGGLVGDFSEHPISWVIGGGESGHKPRPTHPDYARDLRDQCEMAGVPFFWKQWGEVIPASHYDRSMGGDGRGFYPWATKQEGRGLTGDTEMMLRVGKKAAGRLLDGVEHNAIPEPLKPGQQQLALL